MTTSNPDNELTHLARNEGEAWAARRIAELSAEGRPISGGWPGTLSEAKHLAAASVCLTLTSANTEKFQRLSQTLYLSAKRRWMAHRTKY